MTFGAKTHCHESLPAVTVRLAITPKEKRYENLVFILPDTSAAR